MIILNPTYEVLLRELKKYVLTNINYEILVYEDIKDYHIFYNYPLLVFNRDGTDYVHSIKERDIKFDDKTHLVKYYCEKGNICIRGKDTFYIPLIDNGILVELNKKNYRAVLYIIDLYSVVSYTYMYEDNLW